MPGKFFQDSLLFAFKAKYILCTMPHSMGKLLAFPANIRLSWGETYSSLFRPSINDEEKSYLASTAVGVSHNMAIF